MNPSAVTDEINLCMIEIIMAYGDLDRFWHYCKNLSLQKIGESISDTSDLKAFGKYLHLVVVFEGLLGSGGNAILTTLRFDNVYLGSVVIIQSVSPSWNTNFQGLEIVL